MTFDPVPTTPVIITLPGLLCFSLTVPIPLTHSLPSSQCELSDTKNLIVFFPQC